MPTDSSDLENWLKNSVTRLMDYGFKNIAAAISGQINNWDRVSLILENEEHPDAINISFRRYDQLSLDCVLDRIATVLQSNKDFFFNDQLSVRFDHIPMPFGTK